MKQPSVIEYQWRVLRWWSVGFCAFMLTLGLFTASVAHATHLRCARETNTCTIEAHGVWVDAPQRTVALTDVVGMDVDVVTDRRRAFAVATLKTKSGVIDLSGGTLWIRFGADSARNAHSELTRFLVDPRLPPAVDLWITNGSLFYGSVGFFVLTILGTIIMMIRLAVFETFKVRIVVDQEKGVVHVGYKRVPITDIADTSIDVGGRIVVETKTGERVLATESVSTKHMAKHEQALALLREALLQP